MIQSEADRDTIVFLGESGVNWMTTTCGTEITALNSGKPISSFMFHPTQKEWALATSLNTCDDSKVHAECKVFRELYAT